MLYSGSRENPGWYTRLVYWAVTFIPRMDFHNPLVAVATTLHSFPSRARSLSLSVSLCLSKELDYNVLNDQGKREDEKKNYEFIIKSNVIRSSATNRNRKNFQD